MMAASRGRDRYRRLSAILAAALMGGAAVSAPFGAAWAESLTEVLASTYKYNPQLDADRARQRATDEEIARANSGYRPDIQANADIGYRRSDTKPPSSSDGESHPKDWGVTATQNIFKGFRVLNQGRVAEATIRAGRETLRITEQTVLLAAATAYMDVYLSQAIVKLRENNVSVLTRELRATQDRFSVGEVTRTDVAQAEGRRAAAVSQLDLARANLKTARATFERVVGHPPSNLREQRAPLSLLPKSAEDAATVATKEAPNVVNALYTEQAARHNVDMIWGELLPSVTLQANHTHSYDSSPATDENQLTTVTGRLTVPLYPSGGEVHARVRQAKQTHVQRMQQIEEQRTLARSSAISAWSAYQASVAAVESDKVQVNATRTALAGVREEERVGQRTLLDVLNAEQEALNAEVQLATDQRNVIVNAYTVLQAIGRLSVAEIGAVEQAYDPNIHYHEIRRKWWGISITDVHGKRKHVDLWETHGVAYEERRGDLK